VWWDLSLWLISHLFVAFSSFLSWHRIHIAQNEPHWNNSFRICTKLYKYQHSAAPGHFHPPTPSKWLLILTGQTQKGPMPEFTRFGSEMHQSMNFTLSFNSDMCKLLVAFSWDFTPVTTLCFGKGSMMDAGVLWCIPGWLSPARLQPPCVPPAPACQLLNDTQVMATFSHSGAPKRWTHSCPPTHLPHLTLLQP
jgi:hypothetical protein